MTKRLVKAEDDVPFSLHTMSPETLKSEARALRAERSATGAPITHSEALELVAHDHGFRDWNTAVGSLKQPVATPVQVGDKVAGRYLKQAFTGQVIAVAMQPGGNLFKVTVVFDRPVDVVTFESFSAFRTRVSVLVDPYGVSPATTSDGEPHMRLHRATRR